MEDRHTLSASARSGTARRTAPTIPGCVEENADPAPPSNGTGWNHHSNRHERESISCRILLVRAGRRGRLSSPPLLSNMDYRISASKRTQFKPCARLVDDEIEKRLTRLAQQAIKCATWLSLYSAFKGVSCAGSSRMSSSARAQ